VPESHYSTFAELEVAAEGRPLDAMREAMLVDQFSQMAWDASYGPDEAEWVNHTRSWKERIDHSLSFLEAQDPSRAAAIAGRLYRVSYLASFDIKHHLLVAIHRASPRNTAEYSRAMSALAYLSPGTQGLDYARTAVEYARRSGSLLAYYQALRQRGFARAVLGEAPAFRSDYLAAQRFFHATGNTRFEALTCLGLGIGNPEGASDVERWSCEGLRLSQQVGNDWMVSMCRDTLEHQILSNPTKGSAHDQSVLLASFRCASTSALRDGVLRQAFDFRRRAIRLEIACNRLEDFAEEYAWLLRTEHGSLGPNWRDKAILIGAMSKTATQRRSDLRTARLEINNPPRFPQDPTWRDVERGHRLGLAKVLPSILQRWRT
jgi:hypothetical protein